MTFLHRTLKEIAANEQTAPIPLSTDEENDEEEDTGTEQAIVSSSEAENALNTLRISLQQHESTSNELTLLDNMERSVGKIMTAVKKQSSITAFFKPVQKDNYQV